MGIISPTGYSDLIASTLGHLAEHQSISEQK
jgi:hypothetical protein